MRHNTDWTIEITPRGIIYPQNMKQDDRDRLHADVKAELGKHDRTWRATEIAAQYLVSRGYIVKNPTGTLVFLF